MAIPHLDIYDSSGNLIINLAKTSGRILGSITISGNNASVTLPIPSGTVGTPFIFVPTLNNYNGQYQTIDICAQFTITVSGGTTTLNYSFPFSYSPSSLPVYYGVY